MRSSFLPKLNLCFIYNTMFYEAFHIHNDPLGLLMKHWDLIGSRYLLVTLQNTISSWSESPPSGTCRFVMYYNIHVYCDTSYRCMNDASAEL